MTLPEVLLWRVLRTRPGGLKFRRQHPAGLYVLDFYCEAARKGIEIDGMAHDMADNPQRDRMRDALLATAEISIIRIPARKCFSRSTTW
jgi:very-short-patch-repair endonuclease